MFIIFQYIYSTFLLKIFKQIFAEKNMGLIVVIVLIALVIAGGVFWGRYTIQKDTTRKEHDEEELDKLHQLRG